MSPDVNLAKEQFRELNKQFYDGFLTEYFDLKLANYMCILSSKNSYTDFLLKSNAKVGESQFDFDKDSFKPGEIEKYAKLELAMTYYHCLETFVRLFLAHATLSECPWLEVSKLSTKRYKKMLDSLNNDDFRNINDVLSEDDTILFVLTGFHKRPNEISVEDIQGFRKWITWSAHQLVATYDYNSFKHGLAISPKQTGFKMMDLDDNVALEVHGDALEFISKAEKGTRYVWNREIIWIPYDSRAAAIFTISKLIQNIMGVGRAVHLKEPLISEWLPNKDWSPDYLILKKDGQPLFSVTGMKLELAYYKTD